MGGVAAGGFMESDAHGSTCHGPLMWLELGEKLVKELELAKEENGQA